MGFSLARRAPSLASMSQKRPKLKAVAAAAGRDPKRSPLFHWLVKNHDALAPGLRSKRVDWNPVIASAAAEGVKTDWGTDPQAQTIRRTWRKACAHVEAERKATAAREAGTSPKPERKVYPRDMPKDWRPPEAAAAEPPKIKPGEPLAHLRALGPTPTAGPFVPEPDYTGMDNAQRNIARINWNIARNK
jgi:hypothetical protein